MDIETTEDLANKIADWLGVYGGCSSDGETGCQFENKGLFCCRIGFVDEMQKRMKEAVENEKRLDGAQLFAG